MGIQTSSRGNLLLVDDRQIRESMAPWLNEQGYAVETAGTIAEARQRLEQHHYDLALVDVRLGPEDGFELLRECRDENPNMSVIMLTGYGTVDTGVEALRAGAFDLLTKPLIDQELQMAIDRALSQHEVIEENRRLKAQLDMRFGMDNIIGKDQRMQRVFEMIESVADTKATILITGESGTGKSLIARALHRRSSRKDGPFVEVACGALPETLLESELFGHVAGSFTGATGNKIGKFLQADKGSIFLDEIGTASAGLQVKLLRVLQEFEFEPVGGIETHHVDTRTILATNEDLSRCVAEGRFRQDLFYRINVINIELPSLRERIADIPLLAKFFLEQVVQESGKPVTGFTDDAMETMRFYRWPGNVREIHNVVERAVLLGKSSTIGVEDLPPNLTAGAPMPMPRAAGRTLKDALAGPERQIILEVLESNGWNRNETADQLGINRTTLYKKMKRLGLDDRQQAAMHPDSLSLNQPRTC